MPELEFSVYCNTCGAGLCGNTHNDKYKANVIHIDVCPDCMKEKDKEIEKLYDKIEELENKIEELEKGE